MADEPAADAAGTPDPAAATRQSMAQLGNLFSSFAFDKRDEPQSAEELTAFIERAKSARSKGGFTPIANPAINKQLYTVLGITRQEFTAMTESADDPIGKVFLSIWSEYVHGHLRTKQKTKHRGTELAAVIGHLRGGFEDKLRHSMPVLKMRTDWQALDWDAFLVFRLRDLLYNAKDSLLKQKDYTPQEAIDFVWALKLNRVANYYGRVPASQQAIRQTAEQLAVPDVLDEATAEVLDETASTPGISILTPATPKRARKARVARQGLIDSAQRLAHMKPPERALPIQNTVHAEDDEVLLPPEKTVPDDFVRLPELALMLADCDKLEETGFDLRNCSCRYHAYRLIERVCAGELGVEALRQRLAAAAEQHEPALDGAIRDIVAGPVLDNSGLLPTQHTAEEARVNADFQKHLDILTAGQSFSAEQFFTAAKLLRCDPDTFRQPGCQKGLKWWQAIHAAEMWKRMDDGLSQGVILADQVGMGKTITLLAFLRQHHAEEFDLYEDEMERWGRRPAEKRGQPPRGPKPVLVVVPSGLIEQWEEEFNRFSRTIFKVCSYHGNPRGRGQPRASIKSDISLASTTLERDSPLLRHDCGLSRGDPNRLVVLLTSHDTFRARHGPRAFYAWKHGAAPKGWSRLAEMKPEPSPEDEWPADLRDEFDIAVVDEAHTIGNPFVQANQTLAWLNTRFNVLMTATPVWGHPSHLGGLLALVERRGSSTDAARLEVDPFELDDADPDAELRYTRHAWAAYGCSEKALTNALLARSNRDERTDAIDVAQTVAEQSRRMRVIFDRFALRVDYHSECPGMGSAADDIPPRVVVHLQAEFDVHTQTLYGHVAEQHLARLYSKDAATQQIITNGLKLRSLYLVSHNPLFQYSAMLTDPKGPLRMLGAPGKLVRREIALAVAKEISQSADMADACAELGVSCLRTNIVDGDRARPMSEVEAMLSTIVDCGVRLRALLSVLADQVLRRREKALLFVQYPVEQKLLLALLDLVGIRASGLLAVLKPKARARMIKDFNTLGEGTCQVLVCSYKVSMAGHNLQAACRNVHLVDPPPTEAAMHQVIGRVQRMGQARTVNVVAYTSSKTHNVTTSTKSATQIASTVLASVNVAELSRAYGHDGMTADEREALQRFEGFATVDGELVHTSHPAFAAASAATDGGPEPAVMRLEPAGLALWLISNRRGSLKVLEDGVGQAYLRTLSLAGTQASMRDGASGWTYLPLVVDDEEDEEEQSEEAEGDESEGEEEQSEDDEEEAEEESEEAETPERGQGGKRARDQALLLANSPAKRLRADGPAEEEP